MSVFNYIDTFFFISLGITFVLLLLLVLHFKNRLVTLEEKTDTIFEIVNNMVQELNSMKRFHYSAQPPTTVSGSIHTIYDNTGSLNTFAGGKILISDDEDDDSDSESDSDDDDTDDDTADDDSDDGLEVNIINDPCFSQLNVESMDLHDIDAASSSEQEIKMVEINIGEPIVDIDIEKVDHEISTAETEEFAKEDGSLHGDTENKDIHTMTLPELRKLASLRGINHSNKLKKGELIQLLEKESL
jgi:hypothetical protein